MPSILIIDDDEPLRRALRRALERAGYTVFEAPNGAEGMKSWTREHQDLVITDIHMPEKDGIEIIIELLRDEPGAKLLVMSGGIDAMGRLDDAKLLGATRTIAKPFVLDEMLRHVREMTG